MPNGPATPTRVGTSYVEWGPIVAGALAAVSLSFVLLTAGAAIGLSLVSPYPPQSFGKAAASLATGWALIITIGSFLVGGYIAGRLRLTWGEGNPEEVEFRDGVHGILVWALSIILGGFLAAIAGSATTLVGAQVGKASVYSSEVGSVLAPAVDNIMRSSPATPATSIQPGNTDLREEITRILASSVYAGQLVEPNRTYLTRIVMQRASVSSADAEKRVDSVYVEAGRAIELARRTLVLVGLVTTTALLFGLAATWYAAQRGGHHRDHNIPAKFGLVWILKVKP